MTKKTTILFEDYDPSNLNEWDDVLPYEFVIKESAGNDETTRTVARPNGKGGVNCRRKESSYARRRRIFF